MFFQFPSSTFSQFSMCLIIHFPNFPCVWLYIFPLFHVSDYTFSHFSMCLIIHFPNFPYVWLYVFSNFTCTVGPIRLLWEDARQLSNLMLLQHSNSFTSSLKIILLSELIKIISNVYHSYFNFTVVVLPLCMFYQYIQFFPMNGILGPLKIIIKDVIH